MVDEDGHYSFAFPPRYPTARDDAAEAAGLPVQLRRRILAEGTEFRHFSQVLAELQAKTPSERQQRERQNLAHLESFKIILRRNGGEVHDVARAVSAFIMANYAAIAGKELTPHQASSLREQVRQAFATDPKFQASDDRRRQLIYETMAIVADVIWANTAEAREKNDAGRLRTCLTIVSP